MWRGRTGGARVFQSDLGPPSGPVHHFTCAARLGIGLRVLACASSSRRAQKARAKTAASVPTFDELSYVLSH